MGKRKRGRPRKIRPEESPLEDQQKTSQSTSTLKIPDGVKVSTAEEWRQSSQGNWLLNLPSGNTVVVRNFEVIDMLEKGIIDEADQHSMKATGIAGILPVAKKIAPYVVVSPKVVSTVGKIQDGQIHVDSIPRTDLVTIALWFMGEKDVKASAKKLPD